MEVSKENSSKEKSSSATGRETTEHGTTGGASQSLLERVSHLHRPTKEELLAAATGFWQRLGIRFKWLSIRSFRPFNHDEIGAFLSWIFYAHVLWVIIGTTTFISAAIWFINTIFAQETLAGWVGNYLTKSSGIKVVFESAIVPAWGDGVITFKNVFVSRRPGQQGKKEKGVMKGSPTTAAAAAEAAMADQSSANGDQKDDGNYTQFDVTIGTINVTLSFAKWWNGKGLLRDVEIKGVRGVIDRTHVHWDPELRNMDPKAWRHEHSTGDFEIDRFKMDDVLLTVYQPKKFRPFTVSVFNCELPRLRKQWLFYDFMSANNMSGSFDNSLFTVHPRQVHGHTGMTLGDLGEDQSEQWKKHSRLRIDGLNIDHLNRGVEGPFSWITEGNVDIVADVMIPNDEDGIWQKSAKAMSDFYSHMEATVHEQVHRIGHNDREGATRASPAAENVALTTGREQQAREESETDHRFLVMDISVHLNDVRASVPLFTRDLSYINQTLVRPIVAYINSRSSTFIPIHCRVIKRQTEFDGSWTVFDSGLLDDLSRETYEAFVRDIGDSERRMRRMKRVGFWTLQLAAQALFVGLAGQLA